MQLELAGGTVHIGDWGRPFDPALPTVLLLHGAGMDHSVWAMQGRALAFHGSNALAPDLPGHGRSDAASGGDGTIEDRARWLRSLIDAAGLDRVRLVGHSMGALIALEAAAGDPRIEHLVLVGAATAMPVHPQLLACARDDPARAAALIVEWSFAAERRLGAQAIPGSWTPAAAMRLLLAARPGVLAADLEACNAYAGGERAAAAVACPALVIAGAADRMTPPRAGRALAERLPQGRFALLPGCGHMPMLERPRELLALLRDFLAIR